jgi:hypothetical protein
VDDGEYGVAGGPAAVVERLSRGKLPVLGPTFTVPGARPGIVKGPAITKPVEPVNPFSLIPRLACYLASGWLVGVANDAGIHKTQRSDPGLGNPPGVAYSAVLNQVSKRKSVGAYGSEATGVNTAVLAAAAGFDKSVSVAECLQVIGAH